MMGWEKLFSAAPDLFEGFFHMTRLWEYPWALHVAPPESPILDVGSNSQFHVALLGEGHVVTAHYTIQDINHVGLMNCWSRGYHSVEPAYKRAGDRITWLFGFLDRLPVVKYQTIYCLSVIEHVPPEYVHCWMDGMWKRLMPGGKIVFTVDYFPAFGKNCGIKPYGWNHDLSRYATSTVDRFPAFVWDCICEEIPWHADYDSGVEKDEDLLRVPEFGPMGEVLVYGFTLEKEDES